MDKRHLSPQVHDLLPDVSHVESFQRMLQCNQAHVYTEHQDHPFDDWMDQDQSIGDNLLPSLLKNSGAVNETEAPPSSSLFVGNNTQLRTEFSAIVEAVFMSQGKIPTISI